MHYNTITGWAQEVVDTTQVATYSLLDNVLWLHKWFAHQVFAYLQVSFIDLIHNHFTGTLPQVLTLNLSSNGLNGSLPSSWSDSQGSNPKLIEYMRIRQHTDLVFWVHSAFGTMGHT